MRIDLYSYSDVPRQPSDSLPYPERKGVVAIADGVPDVTRKAREILRVGATQIKIAEGAYVDLIVFDGNPLENLDLVSDAEPNFDLIMKIGVIYKNTLQRKTTVRRESAAGGFIAGRSMYALIAD